MGFKPFHFDHRITEGLKTAGYEKTTPIQSSAIPIILGGRDVIATAQTGTGKTAAFVLPILQKLLQKETSGTRALIVTPTRELAEQIHEVIRVLGKHTPLRSATVYGGVGMHAQTQALTEGVDIIVACPGRLLDHLQRGHADLRHIEILVLDEADRMLDMGFWPSIRQILKRVPAKRQTLLFSATFNASLQYLVGDHLRAPERLAVNPEAPAATVAHALYPVSQKMKSAMLLRLLKEMEHHPGAHQAAGTSPRSVLIFTRTKLRASQAAVHLKQAGYHAEALHADMPQRDRQKTLDQFRSGRLPILVATDIAARGLDIASITHVINYDMPDSSTAYTHRIGRTGRAARSGDALTLTTWEDQDTILKIEKLLGAPIERKVLKDFPYDEPLPKECAPPAPPKTMSHRHTVTVRRRL